MLLPFSGKEPYLEAPDVWEDFHATLAAEIRNELIPVLRPRYFAGRNPHVIHEEMAIERTRVAKPDFGMAKATDLPLAEWVVAVEPAPMVGRVTLEVPVNG